MRVWVFASVCAVAACSFDPSGASSTPGADDAQPSSDSVTSIDVAGESDWFDDGYAWRRRLTFTFDPTPDLDEIPVAVLLDSARIEYSETQDAGQDILFVDATNQVALSHEIEQWNEQGNSALWVEVPKISAAGDFIWMYYGNPGTGDTQQPAAVWSAGYVGVWHLAEPATDETTTAVHADSTGNGNTGAQNLSESIGDTSGSVGGAQNFDGSGDFIQVDQAGLSIAGTQITIEARAFLRSEPIDFPHVLGGGSPDGRHWQISWVTGDGWALGVRVAGDRRMVFSQSGSVGEWASLAVTYNGAAVLAYLDAQLIGNVDITGNLDALNSVLQLGNNPNLSPRDLDGIIDEVRISTVARSSDWLTAQHRSANDALIDYGPPQAR